MQLFSVHSRWYVRQWIKSYIVVPLRAYRRQAMMALSSGKEQRVKLAEEAWRSGNSDLAERYWCELVEAEPRSPVWPMRLSMSAKGRGDFEGAERILLDACERGAKDEEIEDGVLRFGRLCRHSNAAVEEAVAIVADPSASPKRIFYTAVFLAAQNMGQVARAGFERVQGSEPYGILARAQLAALDIVDAAKARGRPPIPGWLSPTQNAIVVREPGSDVLVVALAPPEGLFGVPANALHAMLADRCVNAIYLFDSQQLCHLDGSDRFGRGYHAMLQGVRELAAELGTKKLIMLGSSLSGFVALQAGMDLDADGVLAFSPITRTDIQVRPEATRNAQMRVRMLTEAPELMKDLRPGLEARKSCGRIEIYYSGADPADCFHATNLSSVPGVILHEIPGHGRHDSLGELAARGYSNLLDGFLTAP